MEHLLTIVVKIVVFYVVFVRRRDKSYMLNRCMHAWGKLEANFNEKSSAPVTEENTDTVSCFHSPFFSLFQ